MVLFTDMGKQDQIITLTPTDRAMTPGPEAPGCNSQHPTQAINRNPL
jgi:hypothetical protein